MLVLSRMRDGAIVIGDGALKVVVRVVDIRGDKVRLGVEAPTSVAVHREEVYEAIKAEQAREGVEGEAYSLAERRKGAGSRARAGAREAAAEREGEREAVAST